MSATLTIDSESDAGSWAHEIAIRNAQGVCAMCDLGIWHQANWPCPVETCPQDIENTEV
jgi:hypothetical protein